MKRITSFFSLLVSITVMSAALANVAKSAILSSGQTTFDGKLTLLVENTVDGSDQISLKNNDYRAVVVDSYRLSAGDLFACNGRNVTIASNSIRSICSVHFATVEHIILPSPRATMNYYKNNDVAHAYLELTLSWHQAIKVRSSPTPSPTPSALPTP